MNKENKVKIEITDELVELKFGGVSCGVLFLQTQVYPSGVVFHLKVDSLNVYRYLLKAGFHAVPPVREKDKMLSIPACQVCICQVAFRRARRKALNSIKDKTGILPGTESEVA